MNPPHNKAQQRQKKESPQMRRNSSPQIERDARISYSSSANNLRSSQPLQIIDNPNNKLKIKQDTTQENKKEIYQHRHNTGKTIKPTNYNDIQTIQEAQDQIQKRDYTPIQKTSNKIPTNKPTINTTQQPITQQKNISLHPALQHFLHIAELKKMPQEQSLRSIENILLEMQSPDSRNTNYITEQRIAARKIVFQSQHNIHQKPLELPQEAQRQLKPPAIPPRIQNSQPPPVPPKGQRLKPPLPPTRAQNLQPPPIPPKSQRLKPPQPTPKAQNSQPPAIPNTPRPTRPHAPLLNAQSLQPSATFTAEHIELMKLNAEIRKLIETPSIRSKIPLNILNELNLAIAIIQSSIQNNEIIKQCLESNRKPFTKLIEMTKIIIEKSSNAQLKAENHPGNAAIVERHSGNTQFTKKYSDEQLKSARNRALPPLPTMTEQKQATPRTQATQIVQPAPTTQATPPEPKQNKPPIPLYQTSLQELQIDYTQKITEAKKHFQLLQKQSVQSRSIKEQLHRISILLNNIETIPMSQAQKKQNITTINIQLNNVQEIITNYHNNTATIKSLTALITAAEALLIVPQNATEQQLLIQTTKQISQARQAVQNIDPYKEIDSNTPLLMQQLQNSIKKLTPQLQTKTPPTQTRAEPKQTRTPPIQLSVNILKQAISEIIGNEHQNPEATRIFNDLKRNKTEISKYTPYEQAISSLIERTAISPNSKTRKNCQTALQLTKQLISYTEQKEQKNENQIRKTKQELGYNLDYIKTNATTEINKAAAAFKDTSLTVEEEIKNQKLFQQIQKIKPEYLAYQAIDSIAASIMPSTQMLGSVTSKLNLTQTNIKT